MSAEQTFEKKASEVKDFVIDWSEWLGGSDTIATSTWSVAAGITKDSDSNTTTAATVWLSAGTAGTSYTATNTITTDGGRTAIETITIYVTSDNVYYGSPNQVGAFVPRYVNTSGYFDTTTKPTLAHVQRWLEQVSAMLDMVLEAEGFDTPITTAGVVDALGLFASEEVASIAEGVNGSGRFGPTTKNKSPSGSRFTIIMDDIQTFIKSNAIGFERAGASRSNTTGSEIGYRGADNSGDDIAPIFQREAYGNTFADWDSD